jgi:hypothetical protein
MVMTVLGALALAAGVVAYAFVYATNCMTLDFSRPFFASLKVKLYMANLVVGLFLALGPALLLAGFAIPVLRGQGLSPTLSFIIPLAAGFIITQFLLVYLQIWSPLEKRVVFRRLAALGITPEQMASGTPVGISDPTKSSFRKMTLVEDDIGMLWISPGMLIYRGDTDHFDVPRDRFIAMERKADAGSTSSYAGAVHIILRFLDAHGKERRVRLHAEGCPTLGRKAKWLDQLAGRLQGWIDQSPCGTSPVEEVIVGTLDDGE